MGVLSGDLKTSLETRVLSRVLIDSAYRVTRRSVELCQSVHERRRRSDFFYHLAKHAAIFPGMRRYLPLCGASGDVLRIETEERPEGLVFRVSGEVDLGNADRLKEALWVAVGNGRNAILDARALKYIDSTGLHVLIKASQELGRHFCRLAVVGVSSPLAKLVRVLRVETLIPVFSSIDEAAELFWARPAASADG